MADIRLGDGGNLCHTERLKHGEIWQFGNLIEEYKRQMHVDSFNFQPISAVEVF